MTEILEITPGWGVELGTPDCELKFDGCTKKSTNALRVHTCALHFVCGRCAYTFLRRVLNSYRVFATMRCRVCKTPFDRADFFKIVEL